MLKEISLVLSEWPKHSWAALGGVVLVGVPLMFSGDTLADVIGVTLIAVGGLVFVVLCWRHKAYGKAQERHRNWRRAISLAVLGAGVLFAGYQTYAHQFRNRPAPVSARGVEPNGVQFVLECGSGRLPRRLPPDGKLWILSPMKPGPGRDTLLGELTGTPGSAWWSPDGKDENSPVFDHMSNYGCDLIHYGTSPVFDIRLTFDVVFKAAIPQRLGKEMGWLTGKPIQSASWTVPVPSHLAPGGKFTFYVVNTQVPDEWMDALPTRHAQFRPSVGSDPRSAPLTMVNRYNDGHMIFAPASPPPSEPKPPSPQ